MTVEFNIYTVDIIYSAVDIVFHDFLATTRLCSDCGR